MIRIHVPIEAITPHATPEPPPVPVFLVRYVNAGVPRTKLMRGDVPGADELRSGRRATLHIEGGSIVGVGEAPRREAGRAAA